MLFFCNELAILVTKNKLFSATSYNCTHYSHALIKNMHMCNIIRCVRSACPAQLAIYTLIDDHNLS